MMPHEFPAGKTVYDYFRFWGSAGVWQQMNQALREKVRQKAGRKSTPSAAIVDSQSVKTVECTLVWLVRHRRLTIDYEALPATAEAFIYAAMVRIMLRRLA